MTSSVLPPFSSKVTVVTGPLSPPSSLVQTRRECGVTSIYLPKNSSGFEASWPNTKRYLPPTRTSISQERRNMPIDFGTHHCLNSSGLVHASNTMRAGPLKVRVTTSSRSDFRSTVVRFFIGVASLSLLASIDLLLPFQLLDNLVQLVEARVPELAIPLDPGRLFLQSARAELAGPHAPDLLRGDEPGLLQDADVLLHAREGHMELLGKVRNRSVGTPELLQNAASGGVRERSERGIEAGLLILNHSVQYSAWIGGRQGQAERALPARLSPNRPVSRCRLDRLGDSRLLVRSRRRATSFCWGHEIRRPAVRPRNRLVAVSSGDRHPAGPIYTIEEVL